ncbi:type II toxin-antitoxin system RelE/ParE family toxin [Sorangium sp. So ce1335]|uniref:type II toxin-antitoxin system RelE/ParE family toxin n=1 Tax=Sorangium sp. So ce1335 TaxID=3133335 RepID=UPI003F64692B
MTSGRGALSPSPGPRPAGASSPEAEVPRRLLVLATEAEREAHEAFLWYAARDPNVAERFEAQVLAAFDRIADAPEQGLEIDPGVRRLLLQRFPYGLLYAVEPDRIVVLAVMHLRRRPGSWRSRGR